MSPLLLVGVVAVAFALLWGQVRLDKQPGPVLSGPTIRTPSPEPEPPSPLATAVEAWFATFPRRLNALSIDTVVVSACAAGLFALMTLLAPYPPVPGILLVLLIVGAVLYEPVQVAYYGGTIGHRLMNLRVVDDVTGGRPRLLQAFLRTICKGFLGIFAFLTMGPSRRHRAVHDMFTGTTVQIRDHERAQPHHYVVELPLRSGDRAA